MHDTVFELTATGKQGTTPYAMRKCPPEFLRRKFPAIIIRSELEVLGLLNLCLDKELWLGRLDLGHAIRDLGRSVIDAIVCSALQYTIIMRPGGLI